MNFIIISQKNYFMQSIFHTTHHIKVSDNVLSFDLKRENLGVCVNHQIIMKVQIADLVFVSSELRRKRCLFWSHKEPWGE